MIENEMKLNFIVRYSNVTTVYAYESIAMNILHKEVWIKFKELTITFDKQEAQEHVNFRLASSDELTWWSGASGCYIPSLVECSDGVFEWIEPGFNVVPCGLIRI